MDTLIAAAAARALAAGDPLSAPNLIALRADVRALALRGIAMAQLDELVPAKAARLRCEEGLGPRCVVAGRGRQLEYLRPQFRMAPIMGPRSRPFSVNTYSARGGLIE